MRDSLSANILSFEAIYEAKNQIFLCSHHCQICLANSLNFEYQISPILLIYEIAVVSSTFNNISQFDSSEAKYLRTKKIAKSARKLM